MQVDRAQSALARLRLTEILIVAASVHLAYLLRFQTGWFPSPKGVPPFIWYLGASLVAVVLQQILYDRKSWYAPEVLQNPPPRWGWPFAALSIAALFASAAFFLRAFEFSRGFFIAWIIILASGLTASRELFDRYKNQLRSIPERVLLLAAPSALKRFAAGIQRRAHSPIEIVGWNTDQTADHTPTSLAPPLGDIEQVQRTVCAHRIDRVLVDVTSLQPRQIRQASRALSREIVALELVFDLDLITSAAYRIDVAADACTAVLQGSPLTGHSLLVKRAFDVLVGGTAFAVLSPILLILAGLVRTTSRGPALYRQTRVSLDGRPFEILKLRTMRLGAESDSGPVFATDHDERTTPLGRFLRRWSLDELPQLWNVLKGDMSLVGPRPERPHFVEQFRHRYPRYAQRHWMKAGLTGWAQIHGWRGNSSIRKRIQYDLYYLRNWSLTLDVRILLWTGIRVLFERNAY
ncbi:MAG: exopolysaccharide biosynthesis polyprenyl glycosylphosphotransferase [Planctomycetota bacterium]